MNYEDIYMIVNFETIDVADMMIMDEDQKDDLLENDYVSMLLKAYGLSYDILEGSNATLHNVNKTLYIRFEESQSVFQITLLERMELHKYIRFVTSFNFPKKVKLYDVSSQVGGIIDTNFGVKFKIKILDDRADPIRLEQIADRQSLEKDEEDSAAKVFIKAMQGIAADDRDYDRTIDDILELMYHFYKEGINQINHVHHDRYTNKFNIVHCKGNIFFFGVCGDEYYAVACIEDQYLAYQAKEDGEVEILCKVEDISNVCQYIEDYNKNIKAL